MIYSLFGVVVKKEIDYVVTNVNGVAYKVFLTLEDLPNVSLNDEVLIYTHMVVNKNMEFALFGFLNEKKLALFNLLISVNGVGPKTAHSILSVLNEKQFVSSIQNADASSFKKVKGVGQKAALKIILDLQSKLGKLDEIKIDTLSSKDKDIVEALVGMGFEKSKVEKIVSSLDAKLSEDEKINKVILQLSS